MIGQPKWFVATKSWLGAAVPALFLILPLVGIAVSPEQQVAVGDFVAAAVGVVGLGINTWGVLTRSTYTVTKPGEGVSVNPLD